jgi:hypothetical protein
MCVAQQNGLLPWVPSFLKTKFVSFDSTSSVRDNRCSYAMENGNNETLKVLDDLALEWAQEHKPAVASDAIPKHERYVFMSPA